MYPKLDFIFFLMLFIHVFISLFNHSLSRHWDVYKQQDTARDLEEQSTGKAAWQMDNCNTGRKANTVA